MTRNNPPIKLLDAWGGWSEISVNGGGIFDALDEEYTAPWYQQLLTISDKSLDYDYFGNRSGNKKCSPLLYNLMGTATELDYASKAILIQLIHDKFFLNWEALWNSYEAGIMAGYNPFNNFSITETGSHEKENTGTINTDITEESTDSTTTSNTDTIDTTSTTNNSRFGFNSTVAVPTDTSSTTSHTGDVSSGTISDTKSATKGEDTSKTDNEEGSYSKQFSGTKDVIKADIIKKEREIWVVNYFDTVFKDVDSVLTSMIYNRTHEPAPYFWFPFGYNHI